MSFWSEMKRRHVIRVMIAYVLVGVATGGAAEVFLPNLGAPEWVLSTVLVLLILGLPGALVLAWAFEMTPSGIIRDTGAGEVAVAGKTPQSIPGQQAVVEVDHNSIAVLPFADMSPNGDQEYFGDGIAEELINALVKIPDFRVAARTSSFKFKGEKTDVREIGRELGVSAVLEGSVRKEGDQLRVTAQLVSVHDGYHLWSETYDRSIEHIFAIQDELARAIVERCRVTLGEDSPEPARATNNPEAYDLYLQGRHLWYRRHEVGLKTALNYFERALEVDPAYALPYSGVCDVHTISGFYGVNSPAEARSKAGAALESALCHGPDLPETQFSLGLYRMAFEPELNDALSAWTRAAELRPGFGDALTWRALALVVQGRVEEAVTVAREGLKAEPDSMYTRLIGANALFAARRYDEGIPVLRKLVEEFPAWILGNYFYAVMCASVGDWPTALSQAESVVSATPEPFFKGILAHCLRGAGRAAEADAIVEELKELEASRYVSQWAQTHAMLPSDDTEEIVSRLRRAHEVGDPFLRFYLTFQDWDPLRSDPRVDRILRDLGMAAWTAEGVRERFGE